MKVNYVPPSTEAFMGCLRQKGGSLPVYSGTPLQRGYGIGQWIAGMAKKLILPALPKLGKAAAKTAFNVVQDKMAGESLSSSIKKRALQSGKQLMSDMYQAKRPRTSSAPVRKKKTKGRTPARRIKRRDALDA